MNNTALKYEQPIHYRTELKSVTSRRKKSIALWKIKQKAIGILLMVMGILVLVMPSLFDGNLTLSLLIIPGVALQFVKSNFFEF